VVLDIFIDKICRDRISLPRNYRDNYWECMDTLVVLVILFVIGLVGFVIMEDVGKDSGNEKCEEFNVGE
jgi:hypothetical protein